MNWLLQDQLFADAGKATAQQPSLVESLIPFIIIFVAMYFLMIRPQSKKAKEHMNLLKNLKPGDEVITSGGIIAKVRSIADNFVTLETGGSQLKVLKANITQLGKSNQATAKPSKPNTSN